MMLAALLLLADSCSLAAAAIGAPRAAPLASGASVSGLWPRQNLATASGSSPLEIAAGFAFELAGGAGGFVSQDAHLCAAHPSQKAALEACWHRAV